MGRHVSETRNKVLELACLGFTNNEIAKRLNISVSNVDYHLRQIYKEYDLQNKPSSNNRVFIAVKYSIERLLSAHDCT